MEDFSGVIAGCWMMERMISLLDYDVSMLLSPISAFDFGWYAYFASMYCMNLSILDWKMIVPFLMSVLWYECWYMNVKVFLNA
jgi:hypothetical protein